MPMLRINWKNEGETTLAPPTQPLTELIIEERNISSPIRARLQSPKMTIGTAMSSA